MNHPRFQVKTLLIATTIAAVVVACLAPWLRLMTGSQVARLAVGMLSVILGAGLGSLAMRRFYRKTYALQASANPSYHLKSIRIRPKRWMAIGLMSLQLFMASLMAFTMSPSLVSSVTTGIIWAGAGFWLTRAFPQPLLPQGDVLLTNTWLVHPYQPLRLLYAYTYRWKDREAGILELSIPYFGELEMLVRPEDIEAVDTLLSSKLYTPGA